MIRRAVRARRRLLGFLAVLALCGVPLLGFAPAAQAVTGCPPGSYSYAGFCYDSVTGNAVDGPDGKPIRTGVPLRKAGAPSSVIGAQGANSGASAAAAEAASNGSKSRAMLGRASVVANGKVIPVVGAFLTGFGIGQFIAQTGCSFGATMLCYPKSNDYVANTDVVTGAGDVGFVPSQQCVSGWLSTSSPYYSYTCLGMDLLTLNGTQPPVYGQKGANTWDAVLRVKGGAPSPAPTSSSWSIGQTVSAVDVNGATAQCSGGQVGGAVWWAINGTPRWTYDSTRSVPMPNCGANSAGLGYILFRYCGRNAPTDACVSREMGRWYPVGSPLRPNPTADPSRVMVVRNTCVDAQGNVSYQEGTSTPFTEGTAGSYIPVPATVPTCAAGSVVTGSQLIKRTPNGQAPDDTVSTTTVPQSIVDWQRANPSCGTSNCQLSLFKSVGDGLADCAGSYLCEGWFSDPNKSTKYTCKYGPTGTASDPTVALSECNVYGPTFDRESQAMCQWLGNPSTGLPDPGSACGEGDGPVGGVDAGGGESCFPSGWGLANPASWVLTPIKCALRWAFVPDPDSIASTTDTLTSSLSDAGFGPWVTSVSSMVSAYGDGGNGCTGPQFHFPGTGADFYPLSACDPPMSLVAATGRAIITVGVVLYGSLACIRAIGSGLGFEVSIGRTAAAT